AAKIAEASVNKELAAEKKAELERSGKAKKIVVDRRQVGTVVQETGRREVETEEYKQAKKELEDAEKTESELQARLDMVTKKTGEVTNEINRGLSQNNKEIKVSEMTWQQVSDAIEKTEKSLKNTTDAVKIKELKAYNDQLKARKKILEAQTGLGSQNKSKKKTEVADPKTYEELSTNIEIYKKKLTGADTEEQRVFREKIARWEDSKDAIELLQRQAERPAKIETLEDIDKEISYQQILRKKATAENIAGIDVEIARLEELRTKLEQGAHIPTPISEIKTYEQLDTELSYYTALLEKADATQRITIQSSINELSELKKSWDSVLNDLKKPGDISTLNTIEKLDEAISYYQAKQRTATAEEIQNTQSIIDTYERKRNALQRGIEIPSMQREADAINRLTGREYKLKIRGMGFEELTAKINDLQRQLDDLDHPVTATQRKDIESLIATYSQWRKESISAFDTFRNGWDGMKGIGGGIESITDALEGNGNAWQKITAIVDGFIQIYDGVMSIVKIIDMLTVATTAHTTAKTAEAVAVSASTGAQATEAVNAEVAAAAQIPVIVANKLATASYMELAAASYFAAHAYIPFAGFGIASGFVAAATAMVQAIGVMPFADGGVVSGPTIGLIGEYAGASNNPEVVAPLDKLRGMLQPTEGIDGKVIFKIDGRALVGVLEKENNIKHRR
ncbi:MAG: hypothetical protein NC403_09045, partial [Muribaculaceae bacterium]|nr:hypothetical protein [Muribaculaceae bacterium]